jgi:hypothetical protein
MTSVSDDSMHEERISSHDESKMPNHNHFILRIGDGRNFNASSSKSMWGIDSTHGCSKYFLDNVRNGDKLWFVTKKSRGQIVAVATFTKTNSRINGPLFNITETNEELGWEGEGNWNTEVHYKDLYNLTQCNIKSEIKGNVAIRRYNHNCRVNLVTEYPNIVRYSKVTTSM